MKTTVLGVLTIVVAVANAAISFLKTGTFDFASAATAVTAGYGLIKAHDAAPPASGGATQCAPLACLAALGIAVLGLTSCGVVETKPDGTKIEKKPDNTTIGLVVGVGLKVLELLHPEPAAPVVLPTK